MAVSENAVPGPDGRTWSVTTHRERRSLKESGQVPYLWAHVIVTTVMVVVFFFVLKSDAFMILSVMIAIVFIVWLVGFVNSVLRVTISADTVGPPVDHRLWVVVRRRKRNPSVRAVKAAIRAGRDTTEPEGTRLEEI
jgi:hypothetical protein